MLSVGYKGGLRVLAVIEGGLSVFFTVTLTSCSKLHGGIVVSTGIREFCRLSRYFCRSSHNYYSCILVFGERFSEFTGMEFSRDLHFHI